MLLLDGGLATELERAGHEIASSLWSAALLLEAPEAIAEAQREFLAAGAQVVTTATYQASHPGLATVGLSAQAVDDLLRDAVRRARLVAEDAPERALVVGSVGPYGAMLHDGSEYRGDYTLSVQELREFHRRRLHVLAESADVIAVETLPQLREVEAVAAELDALGVRSWVSVSAQGTTLRSGESAEQAFAIAASARGVQAVGANCIDPDDAPELARLAARVSRRPSIIYPNSGETWSHDAWHGPDRWADSGSDLAAAVQSWVAAGAGIIGGCCRVTPQQIAEMASALRGGPSTPAPPPASTPL